MAATTLRRKSSVYVGRVLRGPRDWLPGGRPRLLPEPEPVELAADKVKGKVETCLSAAIAVSMDAF